jgi:hypothetical protein
LTSNKTISSRTLERLETYWPKEPVRRLVDQLYWRAKNRYIALRGASEAGKSTTLNLFLGRPMLRTSLGQTTGCITEIRPVAREGAQGHVHLVGAAHLEDRLNVLKNHVSDDEYADYRRAAMEARQALEARHIVLGETLSETDWQELGFSAVMGQGKLQEIVIDRVTLPVHVAPGHPLRWAAELGVSILDLPGDAKGEVFNRIILAEAQASYPPYASIRVWRADKVDRPDTEPGELLAITFLDSPAADPRGAYVKSIRGSLQDYGRPPFVISAAMDAPAGVDFGLTIDREAAAARLQAWREWLSRPEHADDAAYQLLLRGVEQSLSRGGTGALNDALQQRLASAPDLTVESGEVTQLAQAVAMGLRDLLDELKEPLSPEEELHRRKLEEQREHQARRQRIQEVARAHIYGKYRSSPWQNLASAIDSGSTELDHPGLADELARLVSDHAAAAQDAASAELDIQVGPVRLAEAAQPLIRRLTELIARPQHSVEDLPSFVDVARVQWELSHLLAALLIEADAQPAQRDELPEVDPDNGADREEREIEYHLKAGVLRDCSDWAKSFG